jgi:hypothetical protein
VHIASTANINTVSFSGFISKSNSWAGFSLEGGTVVSISNSQVFNNSVASPKTHNGLEAANVNALSVLNSFFGGGGFPATQGISNPQGYGIFVNSGSYLISGNTTAANLIAGIYAPVYPSQVVTNNLEL